MLAEENKNSGPSALDGKKLLSFLVSLCTLSFCYPHIALHSVSILSWQMCFLKAIQAYAVTVCVAYLSVILWSTELGRKTLFSDAELHFHLVDHFEPC